MLLKDKVAIVTGAGSGIGQGIAMRFATEGAKVVVAELDQRKAAATAAQIAETTRSEALAIPTNVARLEDVNAMVTKTLERFGRIDVLVNNAGIRFASPIVEMSDEEWHNTLATNLTGPFFCLRRVASEMIKSGVEGAIVNIASIAGLRGFLNRAAYGVTKAGVINLTQVAALELAPKRIRVNAIAPGLINTPMTERYANPKDPDSQMMAQKFVATVPLGRWGKPTDIAAAATFLASDEADYITGTTLVVDAGLTAG
jgi:3-oxoacyl-[acyl-carrier protein] reductase